MINPQTARLLTLGLGTTCGVLLLLAGAQQLGVGRGYHWAAPGGAAPDELPSVASIQGEAASLGPASQYAEVSARPLFNEDRKPTPPDAADGDKAEIPKVPLNVTLTGVIITPQVKLAMLRDNAKGEALSLREGMPLPGDQAVWTVAEIQPRKVVFRGGNDETSELPLDVAAVTPAASTPRAAPPPPPPAATPPGSAPVTVDPAAGNAPPPMDRAAELQRRIEERRREMREQAERLRQQQQANPQNQESE